MGAIVNVFAAIFFRQGATVRRQEHGNRVGHQQHPRGNVPGCPEQRLVAHASIVQVNMVHQVM